MERHQRIGMALFTAVTFTLLNTIQVDAKPVPEFGPSVQFDRGAKPARLGDFRGKAVLLVYFQSW